MTRASNKQPEEPLELDAEVESQDEIVGLDDATSDNEKSKNRIQKKHSFKNVQSRKGISSSGQNRGSSAGKDSDKGDNPL
jgi:hypothetical protein